MSRANFESELMQASTVYRVTVYRRQTMSNRHFSVETRMESIPKTGLCFHVFVD